MAKEWINAGKNGNIINVCSIAGMRQSIGISPYAISKSGLIQQTKILALELARYGIRVNALCPGYVITNINKQYLDGVSGDKMRMRIPSRSFSTLADLDGPLLLLASDASRAMTGSCLTVDKGHTISSL